MKKVLIAGGTGFIGKSLSAFLLEKGFKVNVLTRRNVNPESEVTFYQWDLEKEEIDMKAFKGVDAIINLTGANVGDERWTESRKRLLRDSRVKPINLLFECVSKNNMPIKQFISASATGYYGAINSSHVFDESSDNGQDFLAEICKEWETSARQFESIGVPVVILRKGMVIGQGGAYERMAALAKFGINPAVGNGKQYVPWIDLKDTLNLYAFMLNNPRLTGCYNAVAPEDITMNTFASELLHSLGRKKFLPNVPTFLIKLRFGELSSILLKGSRVSSEKLRQAGFEFEYETIKVSFNRLSS